MSGGILQKIEIPKFRGFGLADALVLLLLLAIFGGLLALSKIWGSPYTAAPHIDLAPSALFGYCVLSLSRNFVAYFVSLGLTFWWGRWAAKSKLAERVIIPLVDILQSIPVLAFMPGLVLGLVHIFPHSRVGLELACILMIVTSQAWNMIMAFYQSVKGIPQNLSDAADSAGFSAWHRFRRLELPSAMIPLVWNSMLSVGNGWFFVTVNEAFVLGNQDFRLPGVGSYMSVALDQHDHKAQFYGVMATLIMIVAVDQLLWRPLVVWSQRFRVDEQAGLDKLLARADRYSERAITQATAIRDNSTAPLRRRAPWLGGRVAANIVGFAALALLTGGAWRLIAYFAQIPWAVWLNLLLQASLTFGRIMACTFLSAIWAIPLGIWIGLNPRLTRVMQPLIQIVNSYPAPMLFPGLLTLFILLGLNFEVSVILLMMAGTFAYLLFNVIGGASTVPTEHRDAWACYGNGASYWDYWRKFMLPSIMPALAVGLNTTIGAAWNATIVTEYVRSSTGELHVVGEGLGATICQATESGDLAMLTAAVFIMAGLVVALNRLFWQPLFDYAARLSA